MRPAKHERNSAIIARVAQIEGRGAYSRVAREMEISPNRVRQLVERAGEKSEKAVQSGIVRDLRAMGYFVTTFSQAQRAQMTAGVPDVFAAHPRLPHLWIEVKRPSRRNQKGGGCSTEQLQWHNHARACGLNVVVAYGIQEVIDALRMLGVPL